MSRISGFGGASYSAIVQRAAQRTELNKASRSAEAGRAAGTKAAPQAPAKASGVERLDGALAQVSELQEQADSMVIDLASGREVNVHNTMVALEKADIALKYTVQLRNRALSAYEELMRIQV